MNVLSREPRPMFADNQDLQINRYFFACGQSCTTILLTYLLSNTYIPGYHTCRPTDTTGYNICFPQMHLYITPVLLQTHLDIIPVVPQIHHDIIPVVQRTHLDITCCPTDTPRYYTCCRMDTPGYCTGAVGGTVAMLRIVYVCGCEPAAIASLQRRAR